MTAANGRRVTIDLAGTDLRLAVLDGLAETLPLGALSTRQDRPQPGERRRRCGIGRARRPSGADGDAAAARARVALRVSAVLGHEAAGALSGARSWP